MTVLVIAEHDNAELNDATRAVITAAKKIGGDIHVLVAGKDAGGVAEAASKLDGVAKVLHAEADVFASPTAEAMDALVTPMMDDYDAVLAAASLLFDSKVTELSVRIPKSMVGFTIVQLRLPKGAIVVVSRHNAEGKEQDLGPQQKFNEGDELVLKGKPVSFLQTFVCGMIFRLLIPSNFLQKFNIRTVQVLGITRFFRNFLTC